jgi:hypothetical protein
MLAGASTVVALAYDVCVLLIVLFIGDDVNHLRGGRVTDEDSAR